MFRSQMEVLDVGKLEAYISAEQEARVPIAYKALKAGVTVAAGGAEGRHVRAAAGTYAAASAAVALPCSGDTAKPCCAKIKSGDRQVSPACCHNCFGFLFHT
jgi:hypothetical protein